MLAGVPVLIKGAVANWPIVQKSDDLSAVKTYLKDGSGAETADVIQTDQAQGGRYFYSDDFKGFNFKTEAMTMAAFLSALETEAAGGSLYMGSTPVETILPRRKYDMVMPLVPKGVGPRIWIGNQSVVSPHYDGSSNIACVAVGTRRFTLYPPEQIANLYPGPIEYTVAGPQMSVVNVNDPDFDAYPRYEDALKASQVAEMEAGDALYIPPLWWHHVRATADFNVLVNYWWNDRPNIGREPMEALVLSLLSVRQLPDPERKAWKALFDYFIFQTGGPPMAHIPEDRQGVLGPISEYRANQIWKHFTSLMR